MSFFILGAMLAKNREFLKTQYNKLPFFALVVLVSVAIVLYYNVLAIPEFANRILPPRKVQEWATASGSLIFILLALYSTPFIKLLNHAAINYVGRISYSLYLVHAHGFIYHSLYSWGASYVGLSPDRYLVVVFGLGRRFLLSSGGKTQSGFGAETWEDARLTLAAWLDSSRLVYNALMS